jgi:hypothetical protein
MFNFKHPKDAGMGYTHHLKFSWYESIRAFGICIVMLIHGIIPFIMDRKFSRYIEKASERIKETGV